MREFTDESGPPRSVTSGVDEPNGSRPETKEGDIPMTAGQSTRRLANVSVAPAPLAALLAATLLGGAMIGAGVTLQLGSTDAGAATIGEAQPAGAYDAAGFRADHGALARGADLDGAAFRSGYGALSPERGDRHGGQ
jgi:hypothetical protein